MASLTETALALNLGRLTTVVPVANASGLVKGWALWFGGEQARIIGFEPSGMPRVVRGTAGRVPSLHNKGTVVYAGPVDLFHASDPRGIPERGVQPYWINERTGVIWVATGDEDGPNAAMRTWVPQTVTRSIGALGIRAAAVTSAAATS